MRSQLFYISIVSYLILFPGHIYKHKLVIKPIASKNMGSFVHTKERCDRLDRSKRESETVHARKMRRRRAAERCPKNGKAGIRMAAEQRERSFVSGC